MNPSLQDSRRKIIRDKLGSRSADVPVSPDFGDLRKLTRDGDQLTLVLASII